jgi:hypothetical protein
MVWMSDFKHASTADSLVVRSVEWTELPAEITMFVNMAKTTILY